MVDLPQMPGLGADALRELRTGAPRASAQGASDPVRAAGWGASAGPGVTRTGRCGSMRQALAAQHDAMPLGAGWEMLW
jgi:hypothetical protein